MEARTVLALAAGLAAMNAFAAEESCWMTLHRDILGDSTQSGSYLAATEEEGGYEIESYQDAAVTVSEPEESVYVTEWEIAETNNSGSMRVDLNDSTLQSTVFEADNLPVELVGCQQLETGHIAAVMRFSGTIGGQKYDVEDSYLTKDGALHYVRELRRSGTEEVYAPVDVAFAAKNTE